MRARDGAQQGSGGAGAEKAPKEWVAAQDTRKLLEQLLDRSEGAVVDLAAAAAATPRPLTHGHVHVLVEAAGQLAGGQRGGSKSLALARWLAFFSAPAPSSASLQLLVKEEPPLTRLYAKCVRAAQRMAKLRKAAKDTKQPAKLLELEKEAREPWPLADELRGGGADAEAARPSGGSALQPLRELLASELPVTPGVHGPQAARRGGGSPVSAKERTQERERARLAPHNDVQRDTVERLQAQLDLAGRHQQAAVAKALEAQRAEHAAALEVQRAEHAAALAALDDRDGERAKLIAELGVQLDAAKAHPHSHDS